MSNFIRSNMVVFAQKWLFLGKRGWIWSKVVKVGQSGCNRAKVAVNVLKRLYSGKVVVFGQKLLYSGKLVVFG